MDVSLDMNNPRILVVDDEPDICDSLKRGLERKGFVVDTFEDSLLALENYTPSKYDLCILDIKMPKMNGFELYRDIKKRDAEVKICFCTAHDIEYREEFRKAFPELDERSFISKPSSLTTLVERIGLELKSLEQISENQD